jgi:hypothetical protein
MISLTHHATLSTLVTSVQCLRGDFASVYGRSKAAGKAGATSCFRVHYLGTNFGTGATEESSMGTAIILVLESLILSFLRLYNEKIF